jgi:hypothetical protein
MILPRRIHTIRKYQQQLDALIENKTEAEIGEIHQFFVNYEVIYKQAVDKFEDFIRSKLNKKFLINSRRLNLKKIIEKRENDKEKAAQKMRDMNINFERKSFLGKLFEDDQTETLRNHYQYATSHLKQLRESLTQSPHEVEHWNFGRFDHWGLGRIEQHFMDKFLSEFEEQRKILSKIGVKVEHWHGQESFGVNADFGLNNNEVVAFVNGENKHLSLQLKYTQKYYLFKHDKIGINSYFKEVFENISKLEENLRALASKNIDEHHTLALNNQTKKRIRKTTFTCGFLPILQRRNGDF